MELRVLGPIELAVRGQRVGPTRGRQSQVLAYLLAARGRTVPTDVLIDALWGGQPPPRAQASLHSHVSRLRRNLVEADPDADGMLVTDERGYRLSVAGHDVDSARFEALLDRARKEGAAAPGSARRHLDDALAAWRGPAYGDLADHDLVRPEAVRLEQLRGAAVAERVDVMLAMGDHRAVVGELEALVAVDALDERAGAQLIRAHYLDGRQADALGVYERLREHLAEELGVDPSPQLQDLHRRVLQQDDDLVATVPRGRLTRGMRPDVSTAGTVRAAGGELIGSDDDLIGRDGDVDAVSELVATSGIVTITGPGGVGKTRLARAVTGRAGERFDDGVVWCELAGVRHPDSLLAVLLSGLDLHEEADHPPESRLLAALADRHVLLVLDNGEHLLAELAPVVDRISRRCHDVAVLVTSRAPLRLSQERLWHLAPLAAPSASADAAEVEASPAGQLLCRRARAVDPSFVVTDEDAPTIASLCRRLDGLPLALELAAARLRALAPQALAARLDQRFEVLTGGPSLDAGRHRTLEAVVGWSYELLTATEARLFDRLSVFAGPFPLEAAEQVGADEWLPSAEVAGVLAELVDESLVVAERDGSRVRYRLLDTLRAYGRRRLDETGQLEAARQTHAAHHVRLAEELGARLRGPAERAALADLDGAMDDLREAQRWLLTSADADADGALRLPSALHDELLFRPRTEVFDWVEQALELPHAQQHPAYAAALATAGRAALNRGELAQAQRLAESAMAAIAGDDIAGLWARYVLTTVALYEGRLDDALHLADDRLELATTLGQDVHRVLAGVSRALALRYRGDDAAAAEAATQARRDADACGNETARAWALYGSGEAVLATAPDEAAEFLEAAIHAAQRVDRRFIEGVAMVSLASVLGRVGRQDRALELFRAVIVHWRTLGVHTQQLTTLRNLAALLVDVEADQPAAFLHGAVTGGATPTYGDEADRLGDAWHRLTGRLGGEVARTAADRGRRATSEEVVAETLAHLDRILEQDAPSA